MGISNTVLGQTSSIQQSLLWAVSRLLVSTHTIGDKEAPAFRVKSAVPLGSKNITLRTLCYQCLALLNNPTVVQAVKSERVAMVADTRRREHNVNIHICV